MSRDHRLAVPGGSLRYRTRGQGPPLVLIGGGPSNADTLTELAAQLDDGYTVVTYDRRGYSRSHLAGSEGQAAPEGTERLQVRWVPFAEALGMVERGEITDSLSVMGLQRVALIRAAGR